MTVTELGKEIGKGIREKDSLKSHMVRPGNNPTRFVFGRYKLKPRTLQVDIESQALPTSGFILGHVTMGRLRPNQDFEADCSDNGNNGTWNGTGIGGSQYSTDSALLNSGTFNGTDNYIEVADDDTLSFGDSANDEPFSISAWINPDVAGNFIICEKGNDSGVREYLFKTQSSGWLQFILIDESGVNTLAAHHSAYPIPTGQWTHVVATYDGSETHGGIKLYIDGTERTTGNSSAGGYVASHNTSAQLFVGKDYDTTYADGKIDEFRIYSKELSSAEVTNLYNKQHVTDNLKLYFGFDNPVLGGSFGSWTSQTSVVKQQVLTETGRTELTKWLANESADSPSHMGFGTGTTAYTESDTALDTETGSRLTLSNDTSTDTEIYLTSEIKSTDSSIGSNITELGIFNAASSGDMFSRYVFSSTDLLSSSNWRFKVRLKLFDQTIGNALFTTAGLNSIRNWLDNQNITSPSHVAWGTGTTGLAVGDTTLEGEQERNAHNQVTRTSYSKVQYETLLAAGEANGQALSKSGVFNDASAGTLLCEQLFTTINKTTGFQIYEYDILEVI